MLLFFSIISLLSIGKKIYADTENTINIHYRSVEDDKHNGLYYRLWNITDDTPMSELNKKTTGELDSNYQYIDSGITNREGIAIVNNISNGIYYIRAKTVPNIVPILVKLPLKNNSKIVEIYSKDYVQPGSVILKKTGIDRTNRTFRLQGVKFKLYSKEGIEVNFKNGIPSTDIDADTTLLTNKEGIIKINSILPGMYYFKEIETLPNYKLKKDKFEIKVESNKTSEIEVINEMKSPASNKKRNVLQRYFPKTGTATSFIFIVLGIVILTFICLYKRSEIINNE